MNDLAEKELDSFCWVKCVLLRMNFQYEVFMRLDCTFFKFKAVVSKTIPSNCSGIQKIVFFAIIAFWHPSSELAVGTELNLPVKFCFYFFTPFSLYNLALLAYKNLGFSCIMDWDKRKSGKLKKKKKDCIL